MWKSILEGRNLLMRKGRWTIGRGETTRVSGDPWLWTGEILTNSLQNSDWKVRELILPQGGGWNKERICRIFHPIVALKIPQTPIGLTRNEDMLVWPHEKYGDYSVRSGYHVAKSEDPALLTLASSSSPLPKEL